MCCVSCTVAAKRGLDPDGTLRGTHPSPKAEGNECGRVSEGEKISGWEGNEELGRECARR